MVGRAAGSLRSSQNGPKGQLLIWFLFSVPYTGKILSVSLQRRGFLLSLVMVTLCLSKERLQKGERRRGVELLDGEGTRQWDGVSTGSDKVIDNCKLCLIPHP